MPETENRRTHPSAVPLDQVAKITGLATVEVDRLIASGEMASFRVGGETRVLFDAACLWLENFAAARR
jgi:hypothetical protein